MVGFRSVEGFGGGKWVTNDSSATVTASTRVAGLNKEAVGLGAHCVVDTATRNPAALSNCWHMHDAAHATPLVLLSSQLRLDDGDAWSWPRDQKLPDCKGCARI